MRLLLFDIDGTLLRVNSSGRVAVRHALEQTFGRSLEVDGISFSGKTDPQILSDILDHHGYTHAQNDETFEQALEIYSENMLERLRPGDMDLLPGVRELLRALSRHEDVTLGLVTGNLETTAYCKLETAGLDKHFSFGAFGSDHHDRHELPALALERARTATGLPFEGHHTIIIGDTPHDITCGRAVDARTVAVCTGQITRDELSRAAPDLLLEDLTEHETFIRDVLSLSPRNA
jgi:phosphoglycolate phosphatase-like HAD superfamily hydrolase